MEHLWRDYTSYLEQRYGRRVYRIGIDGGFSCPNRTQNRTGGCIYCDAKGSSAVYQRNDERAFTRQSAFVEGIDELCHKAPPKTLEARKTSIGTQIERGSRFIDSRYPHADKSIYFQAFTSTFDSTETLRELYDYALNTGTYTEFIVSTRPDCVSDDVIQLLASYRDKVKTVCVELGLQSGNDATLNWIGRGHTVADFRFATDRLHEAHLEVSAHIILGFPYEGDAEIDRTAEVITQTHPEAIKIHNLHVVAGTRLYELFQKAPFPVSTREEHVRQTIRLLRHIPSDIVIQRFISDTPSHRLAAPRDFGDKNQFLSALRNEMIRLGAVQGDSL